MIMTKTKKGKFICLLHIGKGEVREYVTVPDNSVCSICGERKEIIMDYGIVAYRGWNLTEKLLLKSLTTDYTWTPRKRQGTETPGFYSIKLPQRTEKNIPDVILGTDIRYYYPSVIGSVYIWGEIVKCEYGYRSEFCYPKHLWILRKAFKDGVEDLSEIYGIPVEFSNYYSEKEEL